MAPGFDALADNKRCVHWRGRGFAGKPVDHFGVAVVRGNRSPSVGCVQAELFFLTIKIRRPIETALNGTGFVVASEEIDFEIAGIFKRPKIA